MGKVMMHAGANLTSLIEHRCNMEPDSHLFSCLPGNKLNASLTPDSFVNAFNKQLSSNISRPSEALAAVAQNYTIYIVSFEEILMHGASLSASRIGLCAPDITVHHTKFDAAERGCRAGFGLGHGIGNEECPGSGGAHGGRGGIGSILSDKTQCNGQAPLPYFSTNAAKFEGSAGGKGTKAMGGSGGGLIWLTASQTLTLNNTELTVRGGDGFEPSEKGQLGSGGGAGGSIQIVTNNIVGNNTLLDLSGGHGSVGGGGGGSGGRFANYFLSGYNQSHATQQSHGWNGTILLEGGKGGTLFAELARENSTETEKTEGLLEQALIQSGGNGEDGTT